MMSRWRGPWRCSSFPRSDETPRHLNRIRGGEGGLGLAAGGDEPLIEVEVQVDRQAVRMVRRLHAERRALPAPCTWRHRKAGRRGRTIPTTAGRSVPRSTNGSPIDGLPVRLSSFSGVSGRSSRSSSSLRAGRIPPPVRRLRHLRHRGAVVVLVDTHAQGDAHRRTAAPGPSSGRPSSRSATAQPHDHGGTGRHRRPPLSMTASSMLCKP